MSERTGVDMVSTVLGIPAPVPLLTANQLNRLRRNFHAAADIKRHWRFAAKIHAIAAHVPPYDFVYLEFRVDVGRQPRRRLPDQDAFSPTIKCIIDGLVDAKVIAGDDPKHVHGSSVRAPEWGDQDMVIVTIKGPLRATEGAK